MTRYPDGTEKTVVTRIRGVNPALLRALSMHHDRRNHQALNQMAPDTSLQQVNVSIVKDFLAQGQGDAAGRLTPEQWNEKVAIDV